MSMAELPRLLAAAPHRPLFLAGTIAVLLTMLWWTLELASLRFGWASWPQPGIYMGFAHAMAIQYGLFPLFMFGFLMTTFPRWMDGPVVPPKRYLPVAGGVLLGYVLVNVGYLGMLWLSKVGYVLMLAGYVIGVVTLAGVLRRAQKRNQHGWSALIAFCVGTLGLAVFIAWLLFGLPIDCAWFAVKLGTYCFLLPIYFTVCHRMLPFFSKNIIERAGGSYVMWRPNWSLPLVWLLLIAHFVLEWRGLLAWRALADIPLLIVFALHWLKWQPWRGMRLARISHQPSTAPAQRHALSGSRSVAALNVVSATPARRSVAIAAHAAPLNRLATKLGEKYGPGLLAVLYLAFAWLPIAFLLFSIQDLSLALGGAATLGRGPLHALAIGFFGSMLIGMVTRVTHGHAGRPLAMGLVPWLCFWLLQIVVIIRIVAEVAPDMYLWLVIAGAGWLVAFLPWVLHGARIYLAPRVDGRPG